MMMVPQPPVSVLLAVAAVVVAGIPVPGSCSFVGKPGDKPVYTVS